MKMAPITPEILLKLKSAFSDIEILDPNSPRYEKSIQRWFRSAEHNPEAVIYPETVDDVSDILRFSTTHGLDIAVCGAGHNGRGNSIENGLVIDLRRMTAVSVDPVQQTVTAQAAATWGAVYAEAEKFDLMAVGGITPSVGVGGFLLNGGYSWLNGAYGMGCDNLLAAEVVLGDGRIVNCSKDENRDIFWALRGAGSAFGIVTKFVLRAYEQKNLVWAGRMRFARSQLSDVVDMINNIMNSRNSDGKAAILMAFTVLPDDEVGILVLPWYNGPETEAKSVFAPLVDLKPKIDTMKMVPYSQSGVLGESEAGEDLRTISRSSAIMAPVDLEFLQNLFGCLVELIDTTADAKQTMIAFEFHNPEATLSKGQTRTAFSNRGKHGNVFSVVTWTEARHDDGCKIWCKDLDEQIMREFRRRQGEEGVDETTGTSTGRYPNYDCLGPRELYGVNHERILSLKKKYDPGNMFKEYVNLLSA